MDFFGPLDKKYCNLFFAYAIFGFVGMLILAVSSVYAIYKTGKPSMKMMISTGSMLISFFVMYLQGRLLYHMCLSS